MSSQAVDFFNPLTPHEGQSILKNCVLEQTMFAIAIDIQGTQAVINTQIDNRLLANRFYLTFATHHPVEGRTGSFSFKLGTRIFFFKSDILKDNKGYYIADNMTIYELRRRRHERFILPKDFSQNCTIFDDKAKDTKLNAYIVDISLSGIRLYIRAQSPEYKVGSRISFSFQIEKRGEILALGTVRFAKIDQYGFQTLGIEFVNTTPLFQNKVQNVCDDLQRNLSVRLKIS